LAYLKEHPIVKKGFRQMMFRLKGWLPKRVTGAKAIFQAWTEK
jgi:hypothetical protein